MLAGTDFAMLAHRARTVKGPAESRWKVWLGLLLPLLNLMYRKVSFQGRLFFDLLP